MTPGSQRRTQSHNIGPWVTTVDRRSQYRFSSHSIEPRVAISNRIMTSESGSQRWTRSHNIGPRGTSSDFAGVTPCAVRSRPWTDTWRLHGVHETVAVRLGVDRRHGRPLSVSPRSRQGLHPLKPKDALS